MIKRFGDARDWFFEKRFGMFIHWGIYSIPAWHEQVLWRAKYTRRDYEKLADEFNPAEFDPNAWIDVLQDAGMEYLCFTTKHHDGFCMFDTKYTDYNITNTPYRKDVLRLLADACRERGVLLCLYYSLPDWHHPAYPNWGRHHEMFGPRPEDEPNESVYLEYVRNQVEELLTGYGDIHAFFWDVNVNDFFDPTLNDMIRELQPQALINDRGPGPGDYSTPERHVPESGVFDTPTEACQSMGRESWGYRETEDYFSNKFLMQSIDKIMAMGGNYLLNVGPTARGTFPDPCITGLKRIGDWYGRIRESIDGALPCSYMVNAEQSGLARYDTVYLTRKRNTLYVHCANDLQTETIVLPGLEQPPETATLLNDGRSLKFVVDVIPWRWKQRPCLRIRGLPVNQITDEPLVVKMEFGDEIVA